MSADAAKRGAAKKTQDAEKLARKKQRRREALGAFLAVFWLLVALGILGGIFFGAYYFWQKETPRAVPVPAYVGRNEVAARAILQKYGLKMVVVSQIYDTKKPAGTVVSGEKQSGSMVRTGREIGVTVSRGAEQVNMPDLTELGLQRAREIIERSGMRLGEVTDQYHDTVPRGYVCGQYPQPGQPFKRSDPINLLVSRGPQPQLNNDPAQLPPPPPRAEAPVEAPTIGLQPREAPTVAQVSRTVHVRVAIAADGPSQEVRVAVRDADGEHTVYQKTHAPGDLVDEDVLVTRAQGTTSVVTIYVDGEQRGQQRV